MQKLLLKGRFAIAIAAVALLNVQCAGLSTLGSSTSNAPQQNHAFGRAQSVSNRSHTDEFRSISRANTACPASTQNGWPPAGNLVVNGANADGDFNGAPPNVYLGNITGTGWTAFRFPANDGGTGVDLEGAGVWNLPGGLCAVDLDGSPGAGGISHKVKTTPKNVYLVSFWLSGNETQGNDPTVKLLRVAAASQHEDFLWDVQIPPLNGAVNGAYGYHYWSFTATSNVTTLKFESLDPNPTITDHGPVVTMIAVTPYPNP